jgi:hypothetical protein
VHKYKPGDDRYEAVGKVVDSVFDGKAGDPTGGATHYYAPAGMPGGKEPRWWGDEVKRAGGVRTIGGHRFAGKADGTDKGSGSLNRLDLTAGPAFAPSRDMERQALQDQASAFHNENDTVNDTDGASIWDLGRMAVDNWSPVQAYRASTGFHLPDDSWRLGQEHLDGAREQGLHDGYLDRLQASQSQAEYEARLSNALDHQARMKEMSEAGGWGTAAAVVGTILDPAAFVASAATLGMAGPVIYGAKAGRLANVARVGLAGAIGGGSGEVAIQSLDEDGFDWDDVLIASASGMVLGGAMGALSRKAGLAPEALRMENAGRKLAKEINKEVNFIDGALSRHSAGAAAVGKPRTLVPDEQFIFQDDVGYAYAKGWRYSTSGMLGSSDNPFTRAIYDSIALDAAGRKSGVTPTAATTRAKMMMKTWHLDRAKVMNPAWETYQKTRKGFDGTKGQLRQQFEEDIVEFIRNDASRHTDTIDPSVQRVGQWWRTKAEEIGLDAQNPFRHEGGVGRPVPGFKTFTKNANYVPRLFNHRAFNGIMADHGEEYLAEFFSQAFTSGRDAIDPGLARRIGKGYLAKINDLKVGIEDADGRSTLSGDMDELKQIVADLHLTGDDAQEAMDYIAKMEAKKAKGSGIARGKRRTLFDEGFKANVRLRDGTGTKELRFDDFLINDFDTLSSSYFRSMSGSIAMAKIQVVNPTQPDVFLINGITNQSDIDKLFKGIRRTANDTGQSKKAVDNDIRRLQHLFDTIRGIGPDSTTWDEWLKRFRDYNYTRVMNQAGFPSAAEVTNISSTTGVKAMSSQMPAFRRVIENGVSIRDDTFGEEIEQLFGFGADRMMGQADFRFDHFGDDIGRSVGSHGEGPALQFADKLLEKGKAISGDIGGLRPVTQITQQMAARAISHRFAMMALGGRHMDDVLMRSLGIDPVHDLPAILADMKKFSTISKSKLGSHKLTQLNTEKWSGQTSAIFKEAVFRFTTKAIQEVDPGMLAPWMSKPMARILFQFRTFMLGAYDAQLLSNMNAFQQGAYWRSAAYFSQALMGGALFHMLRVSLNAAGKEERARKKYWDKMASYENVAAGAFSRTGWATFLPDIADIGGAAAGFDPIFGWAKSTGVQDRFLGNPTSDLFFDKMFGVTSSGSKDIAGGRGLSEQTVYSGKGILPFQNALPFVWFYSHAMGAADLRKKPPRKRRTQ